TRTSGSDMFPCSAGKLATRCRFTANGTGNLIKAHVENVMKQEGGTLQRRQPFQCDHQRKRDVVAGIQLPVLEYGVGEPRPDIGFTPAPCGFQLIEAEACDDGSEQGRWLANCIVVHSPPT